MGRTWSSGHRGAAAVAAPLAVVAFALAGCSPAPRPEPAEPAPEAEQSATAGPAPSQRSEPPAAPSPEPTPGISPAAAGTPAAVVRISDGDTIVTTAGKVRLIGMDTPEQGRCGYVEAGQQAAELVPVGSQVTLVAAPGRADQDKYGRLLRYVQTSEGADLGLAQLQAGYAVARYDSRDGYGWHPREGQYNAADRSAPQYACGGSDG